MNEKSDKKINGQDENKTAEFAAKLDGKGPSKAEQAKAMAKDIAARLDPDDINSFSCLLVVLESSLEIVKDAMNPHELRCKNGEPL